MTLTLAQEARAAEFRELGGAERPVGVWYEAGSADGDARRPLVVLSHGAGGRYQDLGALAEQLAEAGFIAAAPQHRADRLLYVDGRRASAAALARVEDLRRAVELVRSDSGLAAAADFSRIHAVGHSLGGGTVLAAAGAGLDLASARSHCAEHRAEDHAFCARPSLPLRMALALERPFSLRAAPAEVFAQGFVTGGVVALSPVGQGLSFAPEKLTAQRFFILAAEGDEALPMRFHAGALVRGLARALPPERFVGAAFYPGGHDALLPPPAYLPDAEARALIVEEAWGRVVEFLKETPHK